MTASSAARYLTERSEKDMLGSQTRATAEVNFRNPTSCEYVRNRCNVAAKEVMGK